MKEQSNKGTKEQRNNGTTEQRKRRNKGTKEQRNQETKNSSNWVRHNQVSWSSFLQKNTQTGRKAKKKTTSPAVSNQKYDSTLQQSVLFQLSLFFPLESLKTSINGSKLVLNLLLFFSKVCCFNLFILSWSTKHQCLVDSLLCQPHLYLPPLLGFLK